MSKEKTTAVATIGDLVNLGQDGIPGLLEQVTKQIGKLTKTKGEVSVTADKQLPGFGRLNGISSVSKLIQAHSSVTGKMNAYKASAEEMGISIKKFPFKLESCTGNQWLEAIMAQAGELVNKKELEKLRKIQKTLEDNLSQEAKLKNDLAKIGSLLTDDSEVE